MVSVPCSRSLRHYSQLSATLRELISVFALGIAIFTFRPTNDVLFVFPVSHRLVPGVGNSS